MDERQLDLIDESVEESEKVVKKSAIDKVKDLGGKVKDGISHGIDYVKENPERAAKTAIDATIGLGTIALIGLGMKNASDANKTVYSKDIGEDVRLKRKLNNQDKAELDYRMKHNDQTKIEALRDMNLLK